ncbi:MAG: DivIVA domain-containing protein [Ruminococcaceae bacterium]|nr:DivIVA domain-containing protein [Oscillospiraceae bacterium]
MLTPVDIENKEFTKAFRGYDIYEVEEFMKNLVADYEKLYRENAELKEKNAVLGEAIGSYKGMEETMQNAILVAQRTAEDIKQNAYERSETIVKDAQRRAGEAINKANRSIADLEKTYLNMQSEMNGFRAKVSALLSTYMQLLSELPDQKSQQGHVFTPVKEEDVPEASAPAVETAEPALEQQDTNTFTLPSSAFEPETQPAAEPEEKPTPIPLHQTTGLDTERRINPVVEELLRKKREEGELQPQSPAPEEIFDAPAVEKEVQPEPFSVTKETLEKEPDTEMPVIDIENLKNYDVFSDDSI